MSLVGDIFVSFPPKTGTNMLRPRLPQIVELVERKGGDLVLVCVNIFTPSTSLSGCAGRTGFPAALYLPRRRFWFAYKWNGRVGIKLGHFLFFVTLNISSGMRGGHPLADESLLPITAILVRIQAERESRDFILLCFNFFIP